MNNALLIHGGTLGDFVMTLRIVAAIRQGGARHVTVLGRSEIAGLALPHGGVDEVLDLDRGGFHALFTPQPSCDSVASAPSGRRRTRKNPPNRKEPSDPASPAAFPLPPALTKQLSRFTFAVDMLGGPGGVCCRRLRDAGIPRVIGIDPRPRPGWPGHITDQWLADLRLAGIDATPGPPSIRLPADFIRAARQRLLALLPANASLLSPEGESLNSPARRPWIERQRKPSSPEGAVELSPGRKPWGTDAQTFQAPEGRQKPPTAGPRRDLFELGGPSAQRIALIHPGSGARAKCWPLPNFLDLARRLSQSGYAVIFLLGPVERERFAPAELAQIAAAGPTIADHPLTEVRDLLAAADLFIGNDSGVSHLAAALGTPTLAIFGPTNPTLWRPLGDHVACLPPTPPAPWPTIPAALPAGAPCYRRPYNY